MAEELQVDPRLKRIQDRIARLNNYVGDSGMVIRIITLITPKNREPACTVEFAVPNKVLATATYTFEDIMSDDFISFTKGILNAYLKSQWLIIQQEYNDLYKTVGQEKAYETVKNNHPEFDEAFCAYTDDVMRG